MLLDDFTERVDTDVSNDAGHAAACRARRAASACIATATASPRCPGRARLDVGYARAALDALPYVLLPHARVLLAGASGGFRIAEALALGAATVRALEPEPVLDRPCDAASAPRPPCPRTAA